MRLEAKGVNCNEIADDLARLGKGQPLMGLEPAVRIFYTQMKEYFRLWDECNNNKAWI